MAGGSQTDELSIYGQECRPYEVNPEELLGSADQLREIAERLGNYVATLARIDGVITQSQGLPGAGGTAGRARESLHAEMQHLRTLATRVRELADQVQVAAGNYTQAEEVSAGFMANLQGLGTEVWDIFGFWVFSPIAYGPRTKRYLRNHPDLHWLTPRPTAGLNLSVRPTLTLGSFANVADRWLFQTPRETVVSVRGVAGLVKLSPELRRTLDDPYSHTLDREQGALLSQSLAAVITGGGEVKDGAKVISRVVSDMHRAMGHRGYEMEQIPPKHADGAQEREPVRSFEQAIGVMEELDPGEGADYGEIRIDKVTTPDGQESWQVFVPGGQAIKPNNVHSLLHSPTAVDSQRTPSIEMVAEALREVGAQKGEPIVMVGHSHGGITASAFASDPELSTEFDVPLVIAAGSPVDEHEIRAGTQVISFEHTEDVITGVDGVVREHKPGLIRIERTLANSPNSNIAEGKGIYHAHDYPNYVDTARLADLHPELDDVRAQLQGWIQPGEVETYRFRATMA